MGEKNTACFTDVCCLSANLPQLEAHKSKLVAKRPGDEMRHTYEWALLTLVNFSTMF